MNNFEHFVNNGERIKAIVYSRFFDNKLVTASIDNDVLTLHVISNTDLVLQNDDFYTQEFLNLLQGIKTIHVYGSVLIVVNERKILHRLMPRTVSEYLRVESDPNSNDAMLTNLVNLPECNFGLSLHIPFTSFYGMTQKVVSGRFIVNCWMVKSWDNFPTEVGALSIRNGTISNFSWVPKIIDTNDFSPILNMNNCDIYGRISEFNLSPDQNMRFRACKFSNLDIIDVDLIQHKVKFIDCVNKQDNKFITVEEVIRYQKLMKNTTGETKDLFGDLL